MNGGAGLAFECGDDKGGGPERMLGLKVVVVGRRDYIALRWERGAQWGLKARVGKGGGLFRFGLRKPGLHSKGNYSSPFPPQRFGDLTPSRLRGQPAVSGFYPLLRRDPLPNTEVRVFILKKRF